jgi:hypothetical protein
LNRSQALERLEADAEFAHEDTRLLVEFARGTRRGLCHWREAAGDAEDE